MSPKKVQVSKQLFSLNCWGNNIFFIECANDLGMFLHVQNLKSENQVIYVAKGLVGAGIWQKDQAEFLIEISENQFGKLKLVPLSRANFLDGSFN